MTFIVVEIFSLLFLFLPWSIFLFGWLSWPLALLVNGVIGISLFRAFKKSRGDQANPDDDWDKWHIVFILCLSVGWVALSGVGGLGLRNWDWVKHDAIFKDLIFKSWPIVFPGAEGGLQSLIYYIAYYLPAAVVGKTAGWAAANYALIAWTMCGTALALFLFSELVGRRSWWAVLFFVVFGGLDFLGDFLLNSRVSSGVSHIEWWAGIWEYPSHSAQLFWAPQHALSGWIASGLLAYYALRAKDLRNIVFVYSAVPLWSPFIALGLAPFLLISVYKNNIRTIFSFQNLVAAPVLLLLSFFFFSSHSMHLPADWVINFHSIFKIWPRWMLFCAMEFMLYGVFLKNRKFNKEEGGLWAAMVFLVLSLIPIYRFGMFNDFAMRTCTPALFFVAVLIGKDLFVPARPARLNRILFLLVFIGAFTGSFEIARSLSWYVSGVPALDQTTGFSHSAMLLGTNQYNGRTDTFFFRGLGRSLLGQKNPTPNESGSFSDSMIVIEAEKNLNHTRINHRAAAPTVHGGGLIANTFGSSADDSLLFSFEAPKALSDRLLTIIYATSMEGASLDIIVDNKPAIKAVCRNTGSWENFTPVIIQLGDIPQGIHSLEVKGSGINVNLDVFLITPRSTSPLFIEAEDYENTGRIAFQQKTTNSYGGGIVDNGFGGVIGDAVEYSVLNDRTVGRINLTVLYATEKKDAALDIFVDKQFAGHLLCPPTGGWWTTSPVSLEINDFRPGTRLIKIVATGTNINLDALILGPADPADVRIEAENHLGGTRENFIQKCFWASGGRLIGGDFGGSAQDELKYQFSIDRPLKSSTMLISYSAAHNGDSFQIQIDDQKPRKISFDKTQDEWELKSVEIPLVALSKGTHRLLVRAGGGRIGLDAFLIREN